MSTELPRRLADEITKANMTGPIEKEFIRQQKAKQDAIDGDYYFVLFNPSELIDELDVWGERERMKSRQGKTFTFYFAAPDMSGIDDVIGKALMRYIEKHGRML